MPAVKQITSTPMNQRGDWGDVSLAGIESGFAAAVFLLGYQVYVYLKRGAWVALSLVDGLLYISGKNPPLWLLYPDDWVGLHTLLDKTPLALGFVILGVLWTFGVGFIAAKLEEYQEERKQRAAEEKSKRQDESQ
jgi:hypothetical protein